MCSILTNNEININTDNEKNIYICNINTYKIEQQREGKRSNYLKKWQ